MADFLDAVFRRIVSAAACPFRNASARARSRTNPDRLARHFTRPLTDRISRELRESLKKRR